MIDLSDALLCNTQSCSTMHFQKPHGKVNGLASTMLGQRFDTLEPPAIYCRTTHYVAGVKSFFLLPLAPWIGVSRCVSPLKWFFSPFHSLVSISLLTVKHRSYYSIVHRDEQTSVTADIRLYWHSVYSMAIIPSRIRAQVLEFEEPQVVVL